jgi:hypothetical protein
MLRERGDLGQVRNAQHLPAGAFNGPFAGMTKSLPPSGCNLLVDHDGRTCPP